MHEPLGDHLGNSWKTRNFKNTPRISGTDGTERFLENLSILGLMTRYIRTGKKLMIFVWMIAALDADCQDDVLLLSVIQAIFFLHNLYQHDVRWMI